MIKGLKKRWELNGVLLKENDELYVKYNPAENMYLENIFIFDGEKLKNDNTILEIDSIYIEEIKLI